jgi:hypothetical protein
MEKSDKCLNCGADLNPGDRYCHHCGQKNLSSRLGLKELISQFLTDYFAIDSTLWKTLRLLFFKPGKLTKEFIEGKRKRYVPPFRLYIFLSFIYFFSLALSTDPLNSGGEPYFSLNPDEGNSGLTLNIDSTISNQADRDTSLIRITEPTENDSLASGERSPIQEFFVSQANKVNKNPDLFINSLFRQISVAMFFLLPVFGGLLKLFHFKREPYYVSHLVHSVHIHSFLFALFTISMAENLVTNWFGVGGGALVSFVYLCLSLKNVYGQKLWIVLLKAILLAILYFIFLTVALIIVLLIAIALA